MVFASFPSLFGSGFEDSHVSSVRASTVNRRRLPTMSQAYIEADRKQLLVDPGATVRNSTTNPYGPYLSYTRSH